jgi:Uncharacterised nucleotidyltransferase
MIVNVLDRGGLDIRCRHFYRRVLTCMNRASVPFLVGGAYGFAYFTGIERHTKDLDLFVRRRDCPKILETLSAAGFATEITFPHWLAKAYRGGDFIDIIFSSGNNIARVDDEWFEHAVEAHILGIPVRLSPVEEMIWSKSFVMERERFDGADIAHLLRSRGDRLDWERLLRRFADQWPVLLAHLILFKYIYPSEASLIPGPVVERLLDLAGKESFPGKPSDRICRGTILSRGQYLDDILHWGYLDARLHPPSSMTPEEIKRWTDAIEAPPCPP